MIQGDLKKTIIHEIGHFIAFTLNDRIYGSGSCNEVLIVKIEQNGQLEYHGKATAEIDTDTKNEEKNRELFSQRCIGLIYGCIFQCIYLNNDFDSCFGFYHNGGDDFRSYQEVIPRNLNGKGRKELFDYFSKDYVYLLKSKKESFDKIFNLTLDKLVDKNENSYIVNVQKLEIELEEFFTEHIGDFKMLHTKIEEIINADVNIF